VPFEKNGVVVCEELVGISGVECALIRVRDRVVSCYRDRRAFSRASKWCWEKSVLEE
jgi:hypothetical protein